MIPHFMHKNFQGILVADIYYAFQDVTRGLRYLLVPRGLSFCMKNVRSRNLTYGLDWSMACQMWLLKCQQPFFFLNFSVGILLLSQPLACVHPRRESRGHG